MGQHWGKLYDLERIIAMLNIEDKVESTWKLELAAFVKMKRDHQESQKRRSGELLKKKEEELESLEAKAEELRAKGLCRVKFNPYVVEYRRRNGDYIEIRMSLVNLYPSYILNQVLEDFKDSPMIEELNAMSDILDAMAENKKKAEEEEQKKRNEYLAKSQMDKARDTG